MFVCEMYARTGCNKDYKKKKKDELGIIPSVYEIGPFPSLQALVQRILLFP